MLYQQTMFQRRNKEKAAFQPFPALQTVRTLAENTVRLLVRDKGMPGDESVWRVLTVDLSSGLDMDSVRTRGAASNFIVRLAEPCCNINFVQQ